MARRRDRTFTGCWKCRQRKIKCDETKPECLACQRIGVKCAGYDGRYTWVQDDGSVCTSHGRRVLPCASTWRGFGVIPSDVVDLMISECDEPDDSNRAITAFSVDSGRKARFNPFSAIKFETEIETEPPISPQLEVEVEYSLEDLPADDSLFLTPSIYPDWTETDKFLFHHYVTHVAVIMLPYEHPRNAWICHYPAMALDLASKRQGVLHNAILSHASFNIAHLRGNDTNFNNLGMKHYGNAIQSLISAIGAETLDFSASVASIMTLMFAELYSGATRSWRRHFDGAWTLLKRHCKLEPWNATELAFVSLQSLNIIKIIGDTAKRRELPEPDRDDDSLVIEVDDMPDMSSIVSTSEFGFTIGAPKPILDCIARITDYHRHSDDENRGHETDEFLASQLTILNQVRHAYSQKGGNLAMTSQSNAFIQATYVYLYRTLLDVPPAAVQSHVSRTFSHVSAFFSSSDGNFSIWPAFIAAVEAVTEENLARAKEWLDSSTSFGIGSRESIRLVVEEVWRRREDIACVSGLELGQIAVSWRDVMQELDCDILLV